MAGFSIVMLTMLFCWPFALVLLVVYLAIEAAALVVTSPAFPAIIVSVLAGAWGSLEVARVLWHRFRDVDAKPLGLQSFTRTYVLYAISFVAFCVAAYLAGTAIFGALS